MTVAKPYFKINFMYDNEYLKCVKDLISCPVVCSMKKFKQHKNTSCYQHCINVSYESFLLCKKLGFDYRSAARGGLLHDLFLYDWHITKPKSGMHYFTHPLAALENAEKNFVLNEIERDIILKHMWPLTLKPPKYKESLIVSIVDKYCATKEMLVR